MGVNFIITLVYLLLTESLNMIHMFTHNALADYVIYNAIFYYPTYTQIMLELVGLSFINLILILVCAVLEHFKAEIAYFFFVIVPIYTEIVCKYIEIYVAILENFIRTNLKTIKRILRQSFYVLSPLIYSNKVIKFYKVYSEGNILIFAIFLSAFLCGTAFGLEVVWNEYFLNAYGNTVYVAIEPFGIIAEPISDNVLNDFENIEPFNIENNNNKLWYDKIPKIVKITAKWLAIACAGTLLIRHF